MSKITWCKKDQTFETDFCSTQLNLLAHAQAIELEIGSQCGGHGVCGGDRVKIVVDTNTMHEWSPLTEPERDHLSTAEIAQGWRLACQCYPNRDDRDLKIEIRSEIK